MPSILYSTTCYIKTDLYRLRIYVDDDCSDLSSQVETDSLDFTSIELPINRVKPSFTRLSFELLDDKKVNNNIPQTIPLNHLLNVKQTISSPKKYNKTPQTPSLGASSRNSPIVDLSRETSQITLTPDSSQTTLKRRQFSFGRFFSSPSNRDTEIIALYKTLIKIHYVDVSNSIRWNIKSLELEMDTEDIANELNLNLFLCLSTLKQRPRSLLAFVNPLSGKGMKKKKQSSSKLMELLFLRSIEEQTINSPPPSYD
jgi:hypothetical protein